MAIAPESFTGVAPVTSIMLSTMTGPSLQPSTASMMTFSGQQPPDTCHMAERPGAGEQQPANPMCGEYIIGDMTFQLQDVDPATIETLNQEQQKQSDE
jgi:hypothetical protein